MITKLSAAWLLTSSDESPCRMGEPAPVPKKGTHYCRTEARGSGGRTKPNANPVCGGSCARGDWRGPHDQVLCALRSGVLHTRANPSPNRDVRHA